MTGLYLAGRGQQHLDRDRIIAASAAIAPYGRERCMQLAANDNSTPAAVAGRKEWHAASLSALIGHIVSIHHGYPKAELPRIQKLLEVVYAANKERDAATLSALPGIFFLMKDELDLHMHKEEGMLFPSIEETERAADGGCSACHAGALVYPIRAMLGEHESAISSMERIREITRNYALPPHAGDQYRGLFQDLEALERDLQRHIHLEDEVLFPRVLALQSRDRCTL
jgi:regulator of cell morphogenesis and NO signaling